MAKRISGLNSTALPNRLHEVWAERNLVDVRLRIEQILGLINAGDLAAALGGDANFATTVTNALAERLRVDAAMSLNDSKKLQGINNLGLFDRFARVDAAMSLNDSKKLQGINNLGLFDRFARFDAAQSLSIAQKIYALDNIGIPRKGYLFGLTLSNAADAEHDITIASGQASSTNINPVIIDLASSITKRLDATFAEGTANGGMVSGESLPISGTVHAWLGMKADGTTDVFFNNHASSGLTPTNPTDFLWRRRIGSLRTDGSANIRGFIQTGDIFQLLTPVTDVGSASQGTIPTNRSLTVPVGLKLEAIVSLYCTASEASIFRICDPDITAKTAGSSIVDLYAIGTSVPASAGPVRVPTSTTGQVSTSANGATSTFTIATSGWVDTRGRLS